MAGFPVRQPPKFDSSSSLINICSLIISPNSQNFDKNFRFVTFHDNEQRFANSSLEVSM